MRKLISYVVALLIMFDSVVLIASAALQLTLRRESFYQQRFGTDAYISACVSDIRQGVADEGAAAGLPANAVQGAVERGEVAQSIGKQAKAEFTYINGGAASVGAVMPPDAFSQRLDAQIHSYAQKQGITISAQTQKAIDAYIGRCRSVYSRALLQIPYFNAAAGILRKLLSAVRVLALAAAVLLLALIGACLAVRRGNRYAQLHYPVWGILSGGALTILFSLLPLCFRLPYRLNLSSRAAVILAGNLIAGPISLSLAIGLSVFAAAAVLLVPMSRLRTAG